MNLSIRLAKKHGDAINPILAAVGYNVRLILKWIKRFCRGRPGFSIVCFTCSQGGFFSMPAEYIPEFFCVFLQN